MKRAPGLLPLNSRQTVVVRAVPVLSPLYQSLSSAPSGGPLQGNATIKSTITVYCYLPQRYMFRNSVSRCSTPASNGHQI